MTGNAAMDPPGIFTAHGTVIYVDETTGELRHGAIASAPANVFLLAQDDSSARIMHGSGSAALPLLCLPDHGRRLSEAEIRAGSPPPSLLERIRIASGAYGLKSGDRFLCAEPDGRVSLNRPHCQAWEQFWSLPQRFERAETKYRVHGLVHPGDYLFHYIRGIRSLADPVEEYFSNGRNSANLLRSILFDQLGGFRADRIFSLLDFASGFGMVARHYPIVLPNAVVTTCDIHAEANRFNAANIGTRSLQSTVIPEELSAEGAFDVVFSLSFFSHVSDEFFLRWLSKLYSLVKPGGYLVFTTHGRFSTEKPLPPEGIHFIPQAEQQDLEARYYGTSYVAPSYVIGLLDRLDETPRARSLALFREAYWWSHQDLYVVAKR